MFLLFTFEEENPFPSIVLYLAAKPSASGTQYSGLLVCSFLCLYFVGSISLLVTN